MAIIRKFLAKDNYAKVDNEVARNTNISDYSYRLYGFMAGFRNGFQLNDQYVAKALQWNRSKVTRAKRDLVKADLISVEKIDRSTYFLYIGSSKVPASKVKKYWNDQERLDSLGFQDIPELPEVKIIDGKYSEPRIDINNFMQKDITDDPYKI